jgi:hypothetical protein
LAYGNRWKFENNIVLSYNDGAASRHNNRRKIVIHMNDFAILCHSLGKGPCEDVGDIKNGRQQEHVLNIPMIW